MVNVSAKSGAVRWLGAVVFVCASLLVPLCAQGQDRLRVGYQAGRGFGGIGRVGIVNNTAVSRFYRDTGQGVGVGGRPATSQYLAPQGSQLVGRRVLHGQDLLALTPAQSRAYRLERGWQRTLAPTGAGRYFADPPKLPGVGAGRVGGNPSGRLLLSPHELARSMAFAAPATSMGIGVGGVRDPVSAQQVGETEAPYSLEPVPESGQFSQADLMASRLSAARERSLEDAWSWFQRGEYYRARSCFENAEMLDRTAAEPRAGVFFCLVAERKYMQALHAAGRIYRLNSGPDLFDVDYRLPERYEPLDIEDPVKRRAAGRTRMVQHLQGLINFAGTDPASVALAAEAFALWHSDHEQEALKAAQVLMERDPDGSYGKLGERVFEAAARRKQAASQ
jgi:hypothetical protein